MTNSTIIRDARIKLDLTQEELSKILQVTIQTISNWENGRSVPRGRTKPTVERALDLAPGALGKTSTRRGPIKKKKTLAAVVSDEGQNTTRTTPRSAEGC